MQHVRNDRFSGIISILTSTLIFLVGKLLETSPNIPVTLSITFALFMSNDTPLSFRSL